MRILMNPTPTDGAGEVPSSVANQAIVPNSTPTTTPPAPVALPMVQLTPEQYQRLVENDREMARIRAENEEKVRIAERKVAEALGEKEGVQSALNKREDDFGRERSSYLSEIRDTRAESALNAALAGFEAVDDVALAQVRMILAPRIIVEKDANGKFVALDSQTRRPAAEVLREELATPAYFRFRKASHQGGSGMGQGPGSGHGGSPQGGPQPVLQGEDAVARRMRLASEMMSAEGGGFGFNSGAYPGAGNVSGGIGGFGGRQPTNRN